MQLLKLSPLLFANLIGLSLADSFHPAAFACAKQSSKTCTLNSVFSWEGARTPSSTFTLFDETCSQVGQMSPPKGNPLGPFTFDSRPGELKALVVDSIKYPENSDPGHLLFSYGGTGASTDILNFPDNHWYWYGKGANCNCWRTGDSGCDNDTCCSCVFDCSWR